jgi:hypothetical protein
MPTRNQFNPPPLRKITDFKSQLTGGGARSNLFEVVLTFPDIAKANNAVLEKSRFLVKAAALPASQIAFVDVPFRGRTLKVAGDRSFESWTITIINDTDFSIRSAFENWINKMNRLSDGSGATNPATYTSDAYVYQLDRNGKSLRAYHMYDLFPTSTNAIPVSYDQSAIEEFQVELQVLWWEAIKGDSPDAGGININ